MNQLSSVGVFLVLGVVTAACGSAGNAFTSTPDNGGATGMGGASGGSSAGTGNSSAGTATGSGGTDNGSAGTGSGNAGAGNAGTGSGGTATGGTGGNPSSGDAGSVGNSAGSAGSPAGGSGGASTGGSSGAGGSSSPPCPSPAGYYTIIASVGAGCGDFDRSVPVCAEAATEVCRYTVQGTADNSLAGSLLMKANATFEGAMISEGSATRTGCTGSFASDTGVLTVTCGGSNVSSSQYCGIRLTRTADTCP